MFIVSQLLSNFLEIQQTLRHLASNQTNQALVSVPTLFVVDPILYEPVQGVISANADNLSILDTNKFGWGTNHIYDEGRAGGYV